ncbi:competence protein ComJ [Scytonema sp. NUACC26]|uniref:competence protein ComJ n=1 Tax=Scytonema sp. NUACC26 TaxID=3140176 RepID=UPI0034DC0EDD
MMIVSFELGVAFCQIVVYDPGSDGIIHDWTEQQGRQGFSWRPSSVAFGMIGQAPELSTEVWLANEINLRADTVRAILVPFDVGKSGTVRVSDVADLGKEVTMVQGKYALVFETGFINEEEYKNYPDYDEQDAQWGLLPMWCRLTFIPSESVQPEILRQDAELSSSYPLLMEAEPAHSP